MTRSIRTVQTRIHYSTLAVIILFVMLPWSLIGQDASKQYLSAMLTTTAKRSASFYRVLEGKQGDLYVGRTYALSGVKKVEGTYVDESLAIEHGQFTFYHDNGEMESRGEFVMGHKSGLWERYDEFGTPLAEKVYDPEVLTAIIHSRAQTMPKFSEGSGRDLERYVCERVSPTSGKKLKGTITTTFVVEKDGHLSGVRVVNGMSDQIDQQVVEAIRSTSPWLPGVDKGQAVRVRMHVPVRF